jgi:hypothetical protein
MNALVLGRVFSPASGAWRERGRGHRFLADPPPTLNPVWRAAARHVIRLHDLRVFPSGLKEPQFPIFSRETWRRDLARDENREKFAEPR